MFFSAPCVLAPPSPLSCLMDGGGFRSVRQQGHSPRASLLMTPRHGSLEMPFKLLTANHGTCLSGGGRFPPLQSLFCLSPGGSNPIVHAHISGLPSLSPRPVPSDKPWLPFGTLRRILGELGDTSQAETLSSSGRMSLLVNPAAKRILLWLLISLSLRLAMAWKGYASIFETQ